MLDVESWDMCTCKYMHKNMIVMCNKKKVAVQWEHVDCPTHTVNHIFTKKKTWQVHMFKYVVHLGMFG